jgi:hypothetical protein
MHLEDKQLAFAFPQLEFDPHTGGNRATLLSANF